MFLWCIQLIVSHFTIYLNLRVVLTALFPCVLLTGYVLAAAGRA